MNAFVEVVKERMGTRGVKNAALARAVGVSDDMIRNLVNGDSNDIRFSTAVAIAEALEFDLGSLRPRVDLRTEIVQAAARLLLESGGLALPAEPAADAGGEMGFDESPEERAEREAWKITEDAREDVEAEILQGTKAPDKSAEKKRTGAK